MSFQDVGKSRPSSRIRNGLPQLPERTIATLTGKIGNSGSSVKDDASNDALDPRLVSDLILSYQVCSQTLCFS